jgi:hypothetical protein
MHKRFLIIFFSQGLTKKSCIFSSN